MLKEIDTLPEIHGACVIDFWASWCRPCKLTGPILENLSEEYPDIPVYKINADAHPEIVDAFNISGLPTVLFFDSEGELYKSITGAKQKRLFEDCFYAISS